MPTHYILIITFYDDTTFKTKKINELLIFIKNKCKDYEFIEKLQLYALRDRIKYYKNEKPNLNSVNKKLFDEYIKNIEKIEVEEYFKNDLLRLYPKYEDFLNNNRQEKDENNKCVLSKRHLNKYIKKLYEDLEYNELKKLQELQI